MNDLSMECFKAKFGYSSLHLPDESSGGKTYFPPIYDAKTGKVSLIFGYCDKPPMLEELDISDFAANQNFLFTNSLGHTLRQNYIDGATLHHQPLIFNDGINIPNCSTNEPQGISRNNDSYRGPGAATLSSKRAPASL
jgi:hypothetical protein